MITSLVKFILLESEMKGMSIQIRKCNFFWEELQKYSLAPETLFHHMPNNLKEEKLGNLHLFSPCERAAGSQGCRPADQVHEEGEVGEGGRQERV